MKINSTSCNYSLVFDKQTRSSMCLSMCFFLEPSVQLAAGAAATPGRTAQGDERERVRENCHV